MITQLANVARLTKYATLLTLLIAAHACKPPSSTTTTTPLPPDIYILTADVFVVGPAPEYLELFPPLPGGHGETRNGEKILTPTMDQYHTDPAPWKFVRGVMTSGTRLRTLSAETFTTDTHTSHSLYTEVLDGPIKGSTVNIEGIINLPGPQYIDVNPPTSATTTAPKLR